MMNNVEKKEALAKDLNYQIEKLNEYVKNEYNSDVVFTPGDIMQELATFNSNLHSMGVIDFKIVMVSGYITSLLSGLGMINSETELNAFGAICENSIKTWCKNNPDKAPIMKHTELLPAFNVAANNTANIMKDGSNPILKS